MNSINIVSYIIPIIIIVAVVAIICVLIMAMKKYKASKPLTIEEKIVLLDNQLSAGTITKEEYDFQKEELLKNI